MKNLIKIIALSIALLFTVSVVLQAGELQNRKSNDHKKTTSRKSSSSKQRPRIVVNRSNQRPVTKSRSSAKPSRYSGSRKTVTYSRGKKSTESTTRRNITLPTNNHRSNTSRGKVTNDSNRFRRNSYRGTTYKPQPESNVRKMPERNVNSGKAIPRVSPKSNYRSNRSTVKPTYKDSSHVRSPMINSQDYQRRSGSTSTSQKGTFGTQDRRAISRYQGQDRGKTLTIRSNPSGSEAYRDKHVVRTRKGNFDSSRNSLATRDRGHIGSIRMRNSPSMKGHVTSGLVRTKGGGVRRFDHVKPDLARNNYRFVTRDYSGNYRISRNYLFDDDGRWGHAPSYYNGHNYHFYCTLYNQGFYSGASEYHWNRRYYGDGWDSHFGWDSGIYIPMGSWSYGTPYFEPCYAFSFTFNHGYERGYLEGYLTGVSHWNADLPYNSNFGTYFGYHNYFGPLAEYTDGYEQGFVQGYYAGYSGLGYGYQNFGFGDFSDYPVIYDFDYDYYSDTSSNDDYYYEDNSGYEYNDEYSNPDYREESPERDYYQRNE